MLHEVINIDIDYEKLGINHDASKATITTYIKDIFPKDQLPFRRPLVIICPGGGYHHHSPREAATCPPAENPATIILSGSTSHSPA